MADHHDVTSGPTDDGRTGAIDRRSMLKLLGAGVLGAGAAGLAPDAVAASSARFRTMRSNRLSAAGSSTIKIGYITPRTGPLAGFSESVPFVLGKVRATSQYAKGITIGGKHYSFSIKVVDSQSTANRASQVAQQLALSTKVDLILTSSAPETTNPVAAAAQQYHVPCLATVVPWESWYAGLGGDPLKPTESYEYCTMFFFGMQQFGGTFLPMAAVRDDEVSARSAGARVMPTRRIMYVVAALGCGAAGAILAVSQLQVQPSSIFSIQWTAERIFVSMTGGMGTLEGPILGTIIFFVLQQNLAQEGAWYLVIFGAVAVVVAIWTPRGLWGGRAPADRDRAVPRGLPGERYHHRKGCRERFAVAAATVSLVTSRSTPPFRADHVGSLLRPPELLDARRAFTAGTIDADALKEAEDSAIRRAVSLQEEIGLRAATDGEFRRTSWHMDFIYQLGGITKGDEELQVAFKDASGTTLFTSAALHVNGKVRLEHPIFADAFTFLRSVTTSAVPKLTIPSPSMVHYRGGAAAIDPAVYPDVEAFWEDLSAAYAEEIRRLAELGCTYLQLDDTSLAYLNDPAQREMLAQRGDDAEHQHLRYIRQLNAALATKPPTMAITTHLCRGNFQSHWAAEGGYDFVGEALFNELNVDGFFLEYDDARSGDFKPLRFVPKGKVVVLGLVTTKRGELESKDDLKRRIDEASGYIPLDQLCLSPQCGFSSTVEGNRITLDDEIAKLRLVVETAAEVWG